MNIELTIEQIRALEAQHSKCGRVFNIEIITIGNAPAL